MYEEMIRFFLNLHCGGIKINSHCVSMNNINGIMNHVVEVDTRKRNSMCLKLH